MGQLIDGKWVEPGYDPDRQGGEFVRESAQLRDSRVRTIASA